MRSKRNSKKHASHTPPLIPWLNFIPNSLPPPHSAAQGDGEWGLWSVHHVVSAATSSSGIPLLQRGDPPMGDNPLKTLQCESFTWATILHKLLQQWFSHRYNPSGTVCSNVGSPRGQKSCQQICSCFGFSIHGDGACQEVALVWASHGVTVATGLFRR